jgi:single-strand DNA-binding protein
MRGLNRVLIIGRIGQNPELRYSKDGVPWSSLRIATDRRKRQGDEWVEETEWHTVKVFQKQAEQCQKWLKPGSVVAIEGSISYDKWKDKESGAPRVRSCVVADRVTFITTPVRNDQGSDAAVA